MGLIRHRSGAAVAESVVVTWLAKPVYPDECMGMHDFVLSIVHQGDLEITTLLLAHCNLGWESGQVERLAKEVKFLQQLKDIKIM